MNPSPFSALEERCHDLAAPVCARLIAFCAEPESHARFLNTLSLMEHIGSRKIMASQRGAGWERDTLKHMAEEARHAYFFKRQAEKLARRALSYSAIDTIAGASAAAYMGRVDAEITRETGRQGALAYLYMSLIVELRAIWLYRLYQVVLAERGPGLTLKSVLAEEELHLEAMHLSLSGMDSNAAQRIAGFLDIEDKRFRILWTAIEAEGARQRVAAE